MIEIRGLVKDYGGKRAVDGLYLSVGPGVFFTFLGPNGAGKTTTMKIMAGLLNATAGEVTMFAVQDELMGSRTAASGPSLWQRRSWASTSSSCQEPGWHRGSSCHAA